MKASYKLRIYNCMYYFLLEALLFSPDLNISWPFFTIFYDSLHRDSREFLLFPLSLIAYLA